jgi:hypothetical protein
MEHVQQSEENRYKILFEKEKSWRMKRWGIWLDVGD